MTPRLWSLVGANFPFMVWISCVVWNPKSYSQPTMAYFHSQGLLTDIFIHQGINQRCPYCSRDLEGLELLKKSLWLLSFDNCKWTYRYRIWIWPVSHRNKNNPAAIRHLNCCVDYNCWGWYIFHWSKSSMLKGKLQTLEAFLNLVVYSSLHFLLCRTFPTTTRWSNEDPTSVQQE